MLDFAFIYRRITHVTLELYYIAFSVETITEVP